MSDRYMVTVRGKRHEWSLPISGKPEYLEDWRADGLEVVKVEYSIPAWVVDLGLMRPWCVAQNILAWLRR